MKRKSRRRGRRGAAAGMTTVFRYTESEWQAVVDVMTALPPLPAKRRLIAARLRLERAAKWYLESIEHRRKAIKIDTQALERLQHIPQGLSDDLKKHAADILQAERERRQRHSRNRNPQREMLYIATLEVWTIDFKQLAAISSSGPTIRFLNAALGPVMGENTPAPEGWRRVIKRFKRVGYSDLRK
jgi:hypothetical protein